MKEWFEVKVRAVLGPDEGDDKEVSIWGRMVRWTEEGLEYEADPRHRKLVLEHFGFEEGGKGLATTGDKEKKDDISTCSTSTE